ncbi:MAG TPA: polysaccharide deacetylase family protein [Caldimonas sp.]|nr:polysaccharide deacetylase family protein [Caldimonas sp.]
MHAEASTASEPAAPRWRPPLMVKASVAWHAGACVAVAAAPAEWPWALAAVALNHALLVGTAAWPRSTWLDGNLVRLPEASAERREVALTFDDGPDPEVTPRVLDLLDAAHARATFFPIAERAQRQPALMREIVRRGHSVQNHSQRHAHTFSLLGPRGLAAEIGAAQQALADLTGQVPRFFRAPAGVRNPLLGPVLQRLELRLVSWTRRGYDTVQRRPARVLHRLVRGLAPGDILLLHDGHAARAADGSPVSLAVLPEVLAELSKRGLHAVTLPQAIADPSRA